MKSSYREWIAEMYRHKKPLNLAQISLVIFIRVISMYYNIHKLQEENQGKNYWKKEGCGSRYPTSWHFFRCIEGKFCFYPYSLFASLTVSLHCFCQFFHLCSFTLSSFVLFNGLLAQAMGPTSYNSQWPFDALGVFNKPPVFYCHSFVSTKIHPSSLHHQEDKAAGTL